MHKSWLWFTATNSSHHYYNFPPADLLLQCSDVSAQDSGCKGFMQLKSIGTNCLESFLNIPVDQNQSFSFTFPGHKVWFVITSKCLYLQCRFCFQPLGKRIMFVFYYSLWKVSLVYHSTQRKKSCAGPVCEYLTGCLDAEDGHPRLRVTLELVDQMDPLWGWDTAVDADITSLEQQRQEDKNMYFFWRKIQLVGHESSASLNQLETLPCAQLMEHLQHISPWMKSWFLDSFLFY